MPRGKNCVEESTITETKSKSKNKSKALPSISTTTITATPQRHDPEFTKDDFKQLAKNEHGRYMPNSKKVGHAVIREEQGHLVAAQYPLPVIEGGAVIKEDGSDFTSIVPEVRDLVNIEAIEPFHGMHRYRAETPNGTEMVAKRSVNATIGDLNTKETTEIEIACFSPPPTKGKMPFFGTVKPTTVLKDDLSSEAKNDLQEMGKTVKGGHELQIDYASVPQRDLMKSRNPDQNTVMGESAKAACENFFYKMADVLHPDMKQRLSRAFNANFHGGLFENNHRPEWLHLYGWSLAPMSLNPQTADNLGAGPKWANTQMMLLERVVKWFALNSPESLAMIKPRFEMLLDSDLIGHIDFDVKVQLKEKYVELMQKIDPFLQYPLFPKSSDLAQMAGITYDLLHDIAPVSTQDIKQPRRPDTRQQTAINHVSDAAPLSMTVTKVIPQQPSVAAVVEQSVGAGRKHAHDQDDTRFQVKRRAIAQHPTVASPKAAIAMAIPASHFANVGVTAEQYQSLVESVKMDLKRKRHDNSVDEEIESGFTATRPVKNQQFPTQQDYQKSIVQVYTEKFQPNYDTPWQAPETSNHSGSGVVIEHEGKRYILTNAHVAHNTQFLQVRLANSREQKYEAKATVVAYQCDLALLEVDDPEFDKLIEPAELGEMVNLRQEVMTVGFPMGGTEMSISTGIVSRIQVDEYCMSGQDLLHVGVDAAVNHGNSGGPVFSGDKVVGIAFQGWDLQGLGFMIPIPIIRRFLAEAFNGKSYHGFPTLAIDTEGLENAYERRYRGLGDSREGILITRIDKLCDAYSKLKSNDILLSIDGMSISNQGTVDIPGIGNCIAMNHVTQMKRLGDIVKLKILRKNADTKQMELLDIDVVLDTTLGDTEKVSVPEYDKMPTYYINSGICFMPVTRNYMEGAGWDLEEIQVFEEGCALPDAPKKNPDEQIVVVSHVIESKDTKGYGKYLNQIVSEVNGKPVNNLRDVIQAMEGNTGSEQVVTFIGKAKSSIIVKNMQASELKQLLKHHHIPAACSEDLEELVLNRIVVNASKATLQEAMDTSVDTTKSSVLAPAALASIPPSNTFHPIKSLNRRDSIELALSKQHKPSKKIRFNLESTLSKDAESTMESQDDSIDDKPLTKNMLPGLKRTEAMFASIIDRYKDVPEDDEGDDDDYTEEEEISLDASDESDDDMDVEEEAHQVARPGPTRHRQNAVSNQRFFKSSHYKEDTVEKADEADVGRKHGGWHGRR